MGLESTEVHAEDQEAAVRRLEMGASVAEVSRACEVNPNVLHRWRRELREFGAKAFTGPGRNRADENRIAALERKVGQQVVEIRFFAGMFAACRRAAEAASIDYPQLVYPYVEKQMSLAIPLRLASCADWPRSAVRASIAGRPKLRRQTRTWNCATKSSASLWSSAITAVAASRGNCKSGAGWLTARRCSG